jgi:hypothetical protein
MLIKKFLRSVLNKQFASSNAAIGFDFFSAYLQHGWEF